MSEVSQGAVPPSSPSGEALQKWTLLNPEQPRIGVLALQGAFEEHCDMLGKVNADAVQVRLPEDLEKLDGLIIPGGESTTISKIAERHGMMEPLKEFVRSGRAVWGTCAGLIMLAERVESQCEGGQSVIGGLDITVDRNFFGKQVHSFELGLSFPQPEATATYNGVFIRAPAVIQMGSLVTDLCPLTDQQIAQCTAAKSIHYSKISVAVQQGNILGTAFHPELTQDTLWHRYFRSMVISERTQ